MDKMAEIWNRVERSRFIHLKECLPIMTQRHQLLMLVMEAVQIEHYALWCWMQMRNQIPSESALSNAFAEFAEGSLGDVTHASVAKQCIGEGIFWPVSRISTEDQSSRAFCNQEILIYKGSRVEFIMHKTSASA